MIQIDKKNYQYDRKKKIHLITIGENHFSSCIYCEDWFNDSPIEILVESTGESYQLPYCSRKCQIEDPQGEAVKNEVIEFCNSYKNDNIKEQEKGERARKKKLEEAAQTQRNNSALAEEQRQKEKNKLGFGKSILWLVFFIILFYLYDKFFN